MTIKHVAMWTRNLENEKLFYEKFFNAVSNNKYINAEKGFSSYFLNFDNSCGLELMHNDSIPENSNDREKQYTGLIHLAISAGSKENVDSKTEELTAAGYELLSGPRWTGDGYYESCIYDPEGNRIEITI
jgi:lactoylglutathione lyase